MLPFLLFPCCPPHRRVFAGSRVPVQGDDTQFCAKRSRTLDLVFATEHYNNGGYRTESVRRTKRKEKKFHNNLRSHSIQYIKYVPVTVIGVRYWPTRHGCDKMDCTAGHVALC